jgi:hypothetical protein
MLHMALSIRGTRILHSLFPPPGPDAPLPAKCESPSKREVKPAEISEGDEQHMDWQSAGDLYVSSPFAFLHAVEYPECSWENRIVAVQCRFLLREGDFEALYDVAEEWHLAMARLTAVLHSSNIVVPSLAQVHDAERELLGKPATFSVPAAAPPKAT